MDSAQEEMKIGFKRVEIFYLAKSFYIHKNTKANCFGGIRMQGKNKLDMNVISNASLKLTDMVVCHIMNEGGKVIMMI